ncbi:hypothetical protein FIBSPDRAFT_733698 [Athelia psychrophila]|uniref:O-acyltransferase n=1 Tax=Athelia psychrophila TaxID=1759441 RepID=A0A166NZ76_9AGAM|nr:hypothetical protein FIBSPDRAFT_733698 [Fibularhizoctonia sp. CBS 109695]
MATLAPPTPNVPLTPSIGRTNSGGFKTADGTLYVSKPFRSKTSKKMRALITFAPRKSHFDITNESSGANEFRGFFSLFWISMFLFTLRTYIVSFEATGSPLNFVFAMSFSEDAITLALTDLVLMLSTGLCVPFAKAISKGWIPYYYFGMVLQHLLQAAILFTAVTWTFNRQWPWVQSGFLTMHSLVMIMKMHSYMTINGYLKYAATRAEELLAELERVTLPVGGLEKAIDTARFHRAELDAEAAAATTRAATASITPGPSTATSTSHYTDASTANALRQRLGAVTSDPALGTPSLELPNPKFTISSGSSNADAEHEASRAHPAAPAKPPAYALVDHPDEGIAALAREYAEIEGELTSSGPVYVKWPHNITWKNFAVYHAIPTLVYELEYPRTDRIRPMYLFEKTVAFLGTFALLYTVTESFILPLTPTPDQSFFRSLLDLALPFMIAYILLFYVIFECICNAFAELSYFADRQFYEDWWNSTSWDEFSRKWNKPVHTFLLRHVYAPSISGWKLSRTGAMFVTFVVSALAHELVMAVVTKKVRMYLFLLQLSQIPLIAIGRHPVIKRNKLAGNIVFWLGLYAGFPLLCVAYVAY